MTARARARPAGLDFPLVGVLGRRGRFPVVEPLFGPGRTTVEVARGGGSEGDLVLVGGGKKGARVVRRKRVVRYFRLAGHAEWPPTFEMDDTPPSALIGRVAGGPSTFVG